MPVAFGSTAGAAGTQVSSRIGIEGEFYLSPGKLNQIEAIMDNVEPPIANAALLGGAGRELQEIVRMGARAISWVEEMQREIPESKREQLWRRVDRLGKESDPDHPKPYNAQSIIMEYRGFVNRTPESILAVLNGAETDPLPAVPPNGLSIASTVGYLRSLFEVYSHASRWIMLYPWRNEMPPDENDVRPWLKVQRAQSELEQIAKNWAVSRAEERDLFIEKLSAVCPLLFQKSSRQCASEQAGIDKNGAEAWLTEVIRVGETYYRTLFDIQVVHPDVEVSFEGTVPVVKVPTFDIPATVLDWIQARVQEAWTFPGMVQVLLSPKNFKTPGSVLVEWERGALPHVDGVGGSQITMDANVPMWLEQTQTVMRHEMGHVLGFTDCYVEFWDAPSNAFMYYALDPEDAMCALSGSYLPRHGESLRNHYH